MVETKYTIRQKKIYVYHITNIWEILAPSEEPTQSHIQSLSSIPSMCVFMIFLSCILYTSWRQQTGSESPVSRQNSNSNIGQEVSCSQKKCQLSLITPRIDWRIMVTMKESFLKSFMILAVKEIDSQRMISFRGWGFHRGYRVIALP